jgi:hypothetical protein
MFYYLTKQPSLPGGNGSIPAAVGKLVFKHFKNSKRLDCFINAKQINCLTKQPILPGGFLLYPSSCKTASAAAFLA